MKLILADDHALIRRGLRDCIEQIDDSIEVLEAEDLTGVRDMLAKLQHVDLLLLDLYMPGMNGFAGLDIIRCRWPDIRVAVISGSVVPEDVLGVLERGACGFVPKSLDLRCLQNAVRLMLSGERYLPAMVMDILRERDQAVSAPAVGGLSRREREVWGLLRDGRTNKEIGRFLGLQEVTVKMYVRNLLRKLGVANRTQAAMLLVRHEAVASA